MASITIRSFRGPLKRALQQQAKRNGRSVKDEARAILTSALRDHPKPSAERIELVNKIIKRTRGYDASMLTRRRQGDA
ncbi:MAG TPA: hypothetical protein VJL84_10085 [Kiloniellales bacterium]|nr:hypothetical protein [Kiloniellales bacterium]